MFRIGSLLYIPAYLTVTLYRVFASETEDGNFFLMTRMLTNFLLSLLLMQVSLVLAISTLV